MEPIFIGGPKNEDWIKTAKNRKSEKKLHDDLQKAHDEAVKAGIAQEAHDGGIQFEPEEQP